LILFLILFAEIPTFTTVREEYRNQHIQLKKTQKKIENGK